MSGTRVTRGTIHDLPNPLARAYAMAMTIGLVVDEGFDEAEAAAENLLGFWSLSRDESGDIRDFVVLPGGMDADLKAEAIFFLAAMVAGNREAGLDLSPWVHEIDDVPFVAVTRERVAPESSGFGHLAVMMSKEAGIESPTSFVFADPEN